MKNRPKIGVAQELEKLNNPDCTYLNMEVLEMSSATYSSTLSAPDVIDPVEARWAADAIASLARQLDPESIVGVILKRSQRELASLVNCKNAEVDAKPRMRMAA